MNTTWKKRAFALVVLVVLIVAASQHQAVADWLKLRNYQAPADTVALADQTSMTSKARHLFYLNHAALDDKTGFRKQCPSQSEQTVVLGCYLGGESGIAILRVDDARLAGVEQVTAAHEMLHAAYERLDRRDKAAVDKMLQDYADTGLHDTRIKDTLKSYEATEPGQQLNEMHSIFGTEIADLPAPLSAYYRQYFSDRSQVTTAASRYTDAFTSRKEQVARDDAQLKTWKAQIDSQSSDLDRQDQELTAAGARLDHYRSSGDISDYNAGVPGYNAQIEAYNAQIANVKSLIRNYNDLVDTRNALTVEEQSLQSALDSSVPDTK